MKKTIAVIFLAGTVALGAAPLLEGFGKVTRSGNLELWGLNMGAEQRKMVKISLVKNEAGKDVMTVDGKEYKNNIPVRHTKGFLCKAGDKIVVTADVKVVGSFGITLHKYAKDGLLLSQAQKFRLMNRKTPVKFEFVLTEPAGKTLYRVNPVLEFPGKGVSTAENLKIELIPATPK